MHVDPFPQARGLWWPPTLRGLMALLFGVVAVAWPDLTVVVLVVLFGAYALVDGIAAIAGAVRSTTDTTSGRTLTGVMGAVSVGVGLAALLWPDITAIALAWLIGLWALFTGLLEISASFNTRANGTGFSWLIFLSGLLSVILGVLIAFMPDRGAVGLVWAIGALAMVWGIVLIGLGLLIRHEVRRLHQPVGGAGAPPAPA